MAIALDIPAEIIKLQDSVEALEQKVANLETVAMAMRGPMTVVADGKSPAEKLAESYADGYGGSKPPAEEPTEVTVPAATASVGITNISFSRNQTALNSHLTVTCTAENYSKDCTVYYRGPQGDQPTTGAHQPGRSPTDHNGQKTVYADDGKTKKLDAERANVFAVATGVSATVTGASIGAKALSITVVACSDALIGASTTVALFDMDGSALATTKPMAKNNLLGVLCALVPFGTSICACHQESMGMEMETSGVGWSKASICAH